jgi:hypothetical protein
MSTAAATAAAAASGSMHPDAPGPATSPYRLPASWQNTEVRCLLPPLSGLLGTLGKLVVEALAFGPAIAEAQVVVETVAEVAAKTVETVAAAMRASTFSSRSCAFSR